MRTSSRLIKAISVFAMLSLTSCIEILGTQEEVRQNDGNIGQLAAPPSDFQVVPDEEGTTVGNQDTPQISDSNPVIPEDELLQTGFEGLTINNQDTTTRSSNLELRFYTLNRNQLKWSFTDDCSQGQWEPYTPSKEVTINPDKGNRKVYASVQFMDYDDAVGPCYKASILHDDRGPQIIFSSYPTTLEEGQNAEVIYEVTDAGVGVDTVNCKINSLEKPCNDGRNTVTFTNLGLGAYIFNISARDLLGNESEQKILWNVTTLYKNLTQSVRVNNYKKVDILFVIDNSGSMGYEQQSMAQRMRNFLTVIEGLDWQIAVTTTDPTTTHTGKINNVTYTYYGDGDLIPIHGQEQLEGNSKYVLNSSMNLEEAQQKLGLTLQRPETGWGLEQGIRGVYRMVQKSTTSGSPQSSFFRSGAQLAVVLISDEDESANATSNDPQSLINLISTTFFNQKTFTFHSIVNKSGDVNCKNTYGATYGVRYETLSNLTGGVIGSVCETDYAQQVTGIAQGVRDMLKVISLNCVPVAGTTVEIKKDGAIFSETYRLDGLNMVFNTVLPPGDYSIKYTCLK